MLRDATPLDAGAVGGILSEFAIDTPWMPRLHTGAEDVAFAGDMIARGWVRVAGRKDRVEGFLASDGTWIQALYVMGDARGHGLGGALLADVMGRQDRLMLWTFQANAGAQRFYERHGFRAVEESNGSGNDEGLLDVRYVWEKER